MMQSNMDNAMDEEKSWVKFPGHMLPATIFTIMGAIALIRSLLMAKALPPGRTFTQTHIPLRDLRITGRVGISVMTLTFLGAMYHASAIGEGIDESIQIHMTMYSVFFMIGLVSFLESKKRLMLDSGRAALALGLFLESFAWRAHGMMMAGPVDRAVHVYLGYINLADALAFGYSVYQKDSILGHIVAWALLLLQGLWIYFIAFYICCIEIEARMVETHLCGMIIVLTIVIALTIACADLPQVRESHDNSSSLEDGRGEYEVLTKIHCGDDHEGDETDSQESGDSAKLILA